MPTLEELIERQWRARKGEWASTRHWCHPHEAQPAVSDVRDVIPSLSYYADKVRDCLYLLLRNCERYELDFLDTGAWKDFADGDRFRDALYTSMELATDPRLSSLPEYGSALHFVGDLRVFHDLGVFYFRGPTGICAIPASELSEQTSSEITWRTGSANLPLAWHWLEQRSSTDAHHRPRTPEEQATADYDVFISHRSKDLEFARPLYDFLLAEGMSPFLSEVCLPKLGSSDYMKRIDEALDRCKHMVLIATSVEHILSSWVEAEWRVFINEKRAGRKAGNIVTVGVGISDLSTLPISLRYYQVIPYAANCFADLVPFLHTVT